MIRFKLGEQLEKKQFRDSRRITLQEVSESTSINRSTLSKILNQKGYSTGTDVLDRLCAFESRQAGLGNRFQRFAGRIADQMEMQWLRRGHRWPRN